MKKNNLLDKSFLCKEENEVCYKLNNFTRKINSFRSETSTLDFSFKKENNGIDYRLAVLSDFLVSVVSFEQRLLKMKKYLIDTIEIYKNAKELTLCEHDPKKKVPNLVNEWFKVQAKDCSDCDEEET